MNDRFGLQPNNSYERTATERGYEIMSYYETKDEIDHVISQLHGSNIRAFKAHHKISERTAGFSSDLWYLWVKTEDLVEYNRRIKLGLPLKDEKPKKPKKPQDVRRKAAEKIIQMRDVEKIPWKDIAQEVGYTENTTIKYYYLYKEGKLNGKENKNE